MTKMNMLTLFSFQNSHYDWDSTAGYLTILFSMNSDQIEGIECSYGSRHEMLEHNKLPSHIEIIDELNTIYNHMLILCSLLEHGYPTDISTIKMFHQQLFASTDKQMRNQIGKWKTTSNGVFSKTKQEFVSMGCPSAEIPEAMGELVSSWQEIYCPTLSDIARFHYQFEHIHPFDDGNGRIGRLIALSQCLQNNIFPFVPYFDDREKYYSALSDDTPATLEEIFAHWQNRFKKDIESGLQ